MPREMKHCYSPVSRRIMTSILDDFWRHIIGSSTKRIAFCRAFLRKSKIYNHGIYTAEKEESRRISVSKTCRQDVLPNEVLRLTSDSINHDIFHFEIPKDIPLLMNKMERIGDAQCIELHVSFWETRFPFARVRILLMHDIP